MSQISLCISHFNYAQIGVDLMISRKKKNTTKGDERASHGANNCSGLLNFWCFFRFERFLTAKWASFAPLLMMFDEESKWKSHRSSEKEDFEKIAQPQEQLTQSFFPICMSSGINYRRQRRPTRSFPESAIKPERHPPKIDIEDLWELFCVSGHIENESKISWRFLYDTDQHDELHTLNKQAVNEGKVFMA